MMNKYRISEKAIEDLEKIWIYIFNKWSVKQADRYYKLIIDEIEYISENFLVGKSVDHIRKGYRMSKVKSYLIFYRKAFDGKIEIIRILHQMMDLKTRIEE